MTGDKTAPIVMDRATGARGAYSIGRRNGDIVEYWTPRGWSAFCHVFYDVELVRAVCDLLIKTEEKAPEVPAPV